MSRKRKRKNKKNNSTEDNQPSIDEATQILENSNQTNQSSTPPESTDQSKELSREKVEELPKSGQETNQPEQQEQEIPKTQQKQIEEATKEDYNHPYDQQEQGTSSTTKEKSANTQKENRPTTKAYEEFKQEIEKKPRQAFEAAQAKYKEILDKSKSLEAETEKAKKIFLDSTNNDEEKKLISKSKYKEYKKARQEAFSEYRQQVAEADMAGVKSVKISKEDFSTKMKNKIAEKMYGKGTNELSDSESSALDYFSSKRKSESYNKAIKARKEALEKLIKEHRKIGMIKPDDLKNVMTGGRNTGGRNAAKQIEENGFKFGKGKVAMAVMGLAGLAGVTSLMFSGGRQQNSNLYNANQAMY